MFKTVPFCSPTEEDEQCLEKVSKAKHGCLISCSGLHADVERVDESTSESFEKIYLSFEKMSEVLSEGEETRIL